MPVKRSSMYSQRTNDEVLIESACNVRSTKKTLGDRAPFVVMDDNDCKIRETSIATKEN